MKKLAALNGIYTYPQPMYKIYFTPHETFMDVKLSENVTFVMTLNKTKTPNVVDVLKEFDAYSDNFLRF